MDPTDFIADCQEWGTLYGSEQKMWMLRPFFARYKHQDLFFDLHFYSSISSFPDCSKDAEIQQAVL